MIYQVAQREQEAACLVQIELLLSGENLSLGPFKDTSLQSLDEIWEQHL